MIDKAFSLEGKHILITGASSGIGKQTAIKLSDAGAILFITGRNKERLDDTFSKLHGKGHLSQIADLTVQSDIDLLVDKLPAQNGVVYSAGITKLWPTNFIRKEDIDSVFGINFTSIVLLNSKLLTKKKLLNNASLVFISSIATRYMYYGGALYSASKAALETYAHTLAVELGPKGIRANCISPSFVKTEMVDDVEKTISKATLDKFDKMLPFGFGDPVDIANTILFLQSDASKWITGANIPMGTT
jgi:NAD(P)-dependent dehydrogenase (short-subunit alcohol dehydrogenase family)